MRVCYDLAIRYRRVGVLLCYVVKGISKEYGALCVKSRRLLCDWNALPSTSVSFPSNLSVLNTVIDYRLKENYC